MKKVRLITLVVLGLGIMIGGLSLPVLGQADLKSDSKIAAFPETASVTQHKITLNGKILSYTATTGFLPYYNEKGKQTARIFYVAYTVDQSEGLPDRPLTVVFNGGPGSSAICLHLGALGPKVAFLGNGIDLVKPPYGLVDNENTLLDITDLVFVDPVGTGFSEPIAQEEEKLFWGVEEDIHSMAEFIRIYLTQNKRWESSLFIAGESYGGIRASGLSSYLQDMGIYPTGIILVSPALNYATLIGDAGNDLSYILDVSAMAAAAWYHGKIDPSYQESKLEDVLEEVRSWSEHEYAWALWQGNALPQEEHTKIARQLTAYIGLPENVITAYNLRVPMDQFLGKLLEKQRRSMSFYDGRLSGHSIGLDGLGYLSDPITINTGGPLNAAFNNYLERDLKFITDRRYVPLNLVVLEKWDWASGMSGEDMGYPETFTSLGKALRRVDFLRLFVAIGLFDMACVHDATIYEIRRMDLPREALDNITITTYPAGHMMYTDPFSHKKLRENLVKFYQDSLK